MEQQPKPLTHRLLLGEKFNTVLISNWPSVPEILAGFILTKTGRIVERPDYPKLGPQVVARTDRRLSVALKAEAVPLYDQSVQNPDFLQRVILASDLDNPTQKRLKRLALHAEYYRKYNP